MPQGGWTNLNFDRVVAVIGLVLALVSAFSETVRSRVVAVGVLVVVATLGYFVRSGSTPSRRRRRLVTVLLIPIGVGTAAAGLVTIKNGVPEDPGARLDLLATLDVRNTNREPLGGWAPLAEASIGETVDFMVLVQNRGDRTLTDVAASVQHAPHLQVVAGTVRFVYTGKDGSAQGVRQPNTDALFTTGGINAGTWRPRGGFYLRYTTLVTGGFQGCTVTVREIGFARSNEVPELQATADIKLRNPAACPRP